MAESKVNEILSAVVDHVTSNGSEADDALRAKVFELSGGHVGGAAKGTVDATEQDDGRHVG